MRVLLSLTAAAALTVGAVSSAEARGGGAGPAISGSSISIGRGQTVGPQTMTGGTLINQGTIAGGSSTAITSTGPAPVSIVNQGTITSSTGGIKTTGSPSSSIVNDGTITVGSTVTSTTGTATATLHSGISQQTGP